MMTVASVYPASKWHVVFRNRCLDQVCIKPMELNQNKGVLKASVV